MPPTARSHDHGPSHVMRITVGGVAGSPRRCLLVPGRRADPPTFAAGKLSEISRDHAGIAADMIWRDHPAGDCARDKRGQVSAHVLVPSCSPMWGVRVHSHSAGAWSAGRKDALSIESEFAEIEFGFADLLGR